MITRPSGPGFRATIPAEDGGPAVSIWAWTEDDAELMAHKWNMRHYEAMEEEQAKLARALAAQEREALRLLLAMA